MRKTPLKFLLVALAAGAGLPFHACMVADPSPLSQVEISDPSLITPRFTVQKSKETYSGQVYYTYRAELLDAEGMRIELLYGYVTLNGIRMSVGDGNSRYTLDSKKLAYRADEFYTFIVKLSNGQTYSSSVRTPKHELQSATATAMATGAEKTDSVTFGWSGNTTDSVQIEYYVWEHGSPGAEGEGAIPLLKNFGPNADSEDGLKIYAFTGKFHATVFTQGTVHPAFHAGGSIRAGSELRTLYKTME
jgi:hypothetical protein